MLASSFAFAPQGSTLSCTRLFADEPKVIIVTGASRGLGRAIALDLAKAGSKVVVNYAGSEDKAKAVVDECKALGGDAIACQAEIVGIFTLG